MLIYLILITVLYSRYHYYPISNKRNWGKERLRNLSKVIRCVSVLRCGSNTSSLVPVSVVIVPLASSDSRDRWSKTKYKHHMSFKEETRLVGCTWVSPFVSSGTGSSKVFLRTRHLSCSLKMIMSQLGRREGVKEIMDINSICRGSEKITLEWLEESQYDWGVL